MHNLYGKLSKSNQEKVDLVIVTMDPERDTPKAFKQFIKKMGFGGTWKFLRGNEFNTRELSAILGVKYKLLKSGDFSHSNIIHLIDEKTVIRHQIKGLGVDLTEPLQKLNELL